MRALFALLVVVAGTPAHARDASPAVNLATPRIDSSCATSPSTCGAFSLRFDDARRAADEHHAAIVARNAGIASTVIGTVASVVGAALIGANACIDCSSTNGNALIAGSALLVLSVRSAWSSASRPGCAALWSRSRPGARRSRSARPAPS